MTEIIIDQLVFDANGTSINIGDKYLVCNGYRCIIIPVIRFTKYYVVLMSGNSGCFYRKPKSLQNKL